MRDIKRLFAKQSVMTKLFLVQVVKKSSGFYAARISITYSQEPGTRPNSDSPKHTSQRHIFLHGDTV